MPFFDANREAKHHGQSVVLTGEKVIQPTEEEALDGVEKVWVAWGYCGDEHCRKQLYYVRYQYTGGWGPHGLTERVSEFKRRTQTKEMFVVQGTHPVTLALRDVMVR